jgi:putative two-component system response regulator
MKTDFRRVESTSDLELLVSECIHLYYSGCTRSGLDLAAHGVSCARQIGDLSWLRKMLTVHGVFQSDLHNLPEAFEALSEALDLCDVLNDPLQSFSVWLNLSSALLYAELPSLAMRAGRVALEYAHKTSPTSRRETSKGQALANIAHACLFTKEYGLGLRSSRQAISHYQAVLASVEDAAGLLADCSLIFATQARLFQRVGLLREAGASLSKAREMVTKIPLYPRAAESLGIASALHDVYSGQVDDGIERLLEFTRHQRSPELIADAWRDLIEAHAFAGRQELAAKYMQQLADHMRRARSSDILFHHKRHLDRLTGGSVRQNSDFTESPGQLFTVRSGERRRHRAEEQSRLLEDLSVAAELHDDPSGRHPYRVAELARKLANAAGIAATDAKRIATAALLHDVGKIAVPALILAKPGPLLRDETDVMRTHVTGGAELLASLEIDDQETAIAVVRHHHEWWSGNGYPDGLAGEAIPLSARVVSLAEAFDAMTHDRPYRPGLSIVRTLDVIAERSGHQFDPDLARVFCVLIRELCVRHPNFDKYLERDLRESGFLKTKRRFFERERALAADRTSNEDS